MMTLDGPVSASGEELEPLLDLRFGELELVGDQRAHVQPALVDELHGEGKVHLGFRVDRSDQGEIFKEQVLIGDRLVGPVGDAEAEDRSPLAGQGDGEVQGDLLVADGLDHQVGHLAVGDPGDGGDGVLPIGVDAVGSAHPFGGGPAVLGSARYR
ncbi:MAG: hypothetical protein KatS3mg115_1658 [Candidatus Poribacteria bacterium]|nr:MAG: hypothetical protein KatS3mg115_1658 [Candidatus Poribacteria bacterium]